MTAARFVAFASAVLVALPSPALASSYSDALRAAATQLDHAANANHTAPFVHVPPAPLGGPPRYSPSVDDWLQAALNAARREKPVKARSTAMRSIASALRYLADAGDQPQTARPSRDVGSTVSAILSDPAYRQAPTKAAGPPKENIIQRAIRWFLEQIGKLFDSLARATQGVPFLGNVFAAVLIAIAVIGLGYVGYRIADGLWLRRRTTALDEGEALPIGASAEQLHEAALAAARTGHFARAVALLFQASLMLLDRTGRIAFDPARTAGEYRSLVRRKVQWIAPDFDSLARMFTAAAYADAPLVEADWARASLAFEALGRPLGTGTP